jgi:hypothetical protein
MKAPGIPSRPVGQEAGENPALERPSASLHISTVLQIR